MCCRRTSTEMGIGGRSISPGVWKRAQFLEPSCEDECTFQLVQYAT